MRFQIGDLCNYNSRMVLIVQYTTEHEDDGPYDYGGIFILEADNDDLTIPFNDDELTKL